MRTEGVSQVGRGIFPFAMDFDTFSRRAQEIAASIPAEFMAGIQSVDVHRESKRDPNLEDVHTLGECSTSPLSDPTGQEPFRSIVHVYYGSFREMAEKDPSFDLEEELRETIEHEVQHHLEDRAGIRDLRDEDDLFEAHARFRAGMETPAGWYRRGEEVGPHLWAVDLDLFLELSLRRKEWEALRGKTFHVRLHRRGHRRELPTPAEERFLDEATRATGAPGRIAFDDPDAVVAVETVGDRAGLPAWGREELRRSPFLHTD